jgi:hypothetical protein
MSTNISLNLKSIKPKLKKYMPLLNKHLVFAVTLVVLLAYLIVVWRISGLATAEPNSSDTSAEVSTAIPKVDKKAVQQILTLEQSSTEIHSLFNSARNNPFQE